MPWRDEMRRGELCHSPKFALFPFDIWTSSVVVPFVLTNMSLYDELEREQPPSINNHPFPYQNWSVGAHHYHNIAQPNHHSCPNKPTIFPRTTPVFSSIYNGRMNCTCPPILISSNLQSTVPTPTLFVWLPFPPSQVQSPTPISAQYNPNYGDHAVLIPKPSQTKPNHGTTKPSPPPFSHRVPYITDNHSHRPLALWF